MADQQKLDPNKKDQAQSEQFKKQDTKEEIAAKVKELREQIDEQLNESDDINPMLVERINQIFNDVIAAIPPDPQEPKFQRATIATTMTKLKEQATGALENLGTKKEVADRFKGPFEEAEKKAKEEDQKKGTAQPAGPSQSQEQSRIRDQDQYPEQRQDQDHHPDQRR